MPFNAELKMSAAASNIGIITVDNPPVNAMGVGVPRSIIACLETAIADVDVHGVVLTASGNGAFAGADIKMQGKPWPEGEAKLSDVIAALDRCDKPVAMVIRKAALGGGLELSMACRYRVAEAGALLGQPEVKLGIPPGAGGTQRLPRLVGIEKALEMIVSGEPITVAEGRASGLIDEIAVSDDPVQEAAIFLAGRIVSGEIRPCTSDLPRPAASHEVFEMARILAKAKMPGQQAPLACIDCVEAATRLTIDDGLAFERERFQQCVTSDQAKALRHVFFAERQANKIPGLDPSIPLRSINSVAVLGAGTMGSGIAMALASAGILVIMIEREQQALDRGLERVAANFRRQAEKGRMNTETAEACIAGTSGSLKLDATKSVDLVIEAVYEDMTVKKSVFAELTGHTRPGTILATNTSYLDINEIAAAAGNRNADVVGLHFFSPANIMKLLEVVRSETTSDDVLGTCMQLGRRLGKTAIVSGVCHGFIGNRMFSEYNREAEFLLQEGATVQQVDDALNSFGMAMGPFAVRDLAGLDIGWAKRKSTAHLRNPEARYSRIGDVICENGWFGQKTQKGFYVYEDGKRQPNPDLPAIIEETGKTDGILPRAVSDEDVVTRCLYAMINEGAKILHEKIALRASDIDLVFIYGYGFPRWRGGPMFWADTVGLDKVLETIRTFDQSHDFWAPAPLLENLVMRGINFTDWDKENAR